LPSAAPLTPGGCASHPGVRRRGLARLGWLLAGRLLRALRAIVATARDICATNLSRRLRTGKRDHEFSGLGLTRNDLFARLVASFEPRIPGPRAVSTSR
jgi:hypothetical protein